MNNLPSAGLGARLAQYRKLAGLSARELSEALGGELSRGVIANIESGRKTDVTVDQLLALSWALGVPPAALALPLENPYEALHLTAGDSAQETVATLLPWFEGTEPRDSASATNLAGALASQRLDAIRAHAKLRASAVEIRTQATPERYPSADPAELEGMIRVRDVELRDHEKWMRQLGMSVDELGTPHGDG